MRCRLDVMGFWSKLWPFAKADLIAEHPAAALETFRRTHRALAKANIPHAMIGGLALGALGIPRLTKDVDYLIEPEQKLRVAAIMVALGFQQVEDNETFSSFVFDVYMRVDFLHARSDRTRTMLHNARREQYQGTEMLVVQPEDLIGLKLQALKNRPWHSSDRADIERVVDSYAKQLDLSRIRDYCQVLELPDELERIIARINGAATG
ncbi:MAG: nucleotidyltransferase [Clostridia bacterium]|nr:nucleotidyltransferase [Deltaproteobacteria bacterium]